MKTVGSMRELCWRCVKHQVQCIVLSGRAQCENCQAKHYGCSLVPLKEVMGGRGGPSGSQHMKAMAGSQTKGVLRKARKAITLGKSKSITTPLLLNIHARTW